MRNTLSDPAFFKEYKKLAGDNPSPLTAEALEKAIREVPREPEVIELFHKLAGAAPLPPR